MNADMLVLGTILDIYGKRGDDNMCIQLNGAAAEHAKQPPKNRPSRVGAALWYANRGLRVFPLLSDAKRPLPRSHGVKDATDDPDTLAYWFRLCRHNIGIAAGGLFDVIDIDGGEGCRAFTDMLADGAPWLDVRAISQTPRGFHIWTPAVPGAKNGSYETTGIDYRAEGGYVVAPPSTVDGKLYRWLMPPIL